MRTRVLLWALELSPMAHFLEIPSSIPRISGSSCLVCIRALVSLTQVRVPVPHWFLFAEQDPVILFFFNLIPMVGDGSGLPDHQTASMKMPVIHISLSKQLDRVQCMVFTGSQYYSLVFSDHLSFSLVIPARNTFMMAGIYMNNRPSFFQIST